MTIITAEIRRRDGKLVRVHPDGREEFVPKRPIRPTTDADIEAAAAADPDARPMTAEQLAMARRVPRVRTLRRALGLSQDEFASRFHIPRTEPDQPARAYLQLIARDPQSVQRALQPLREPPNN